jgi:hypothetical protein
LMRWLPAWPNHHSESPFDQNVLKIRSVEQHWLE